ncbi:glycosyltransferase [Roseivirga misakiensis]|uniref:Glycosyltransferase 2-like domain-containing protein n=1 Tax=Roseivirga misakiensis TaxID=1563681 RepID=A0A1E5T1T7_9BACT|nr:glycosyltransferase [Roseivirga misakiensis]OEK05335.1 hypothetical protein BFP71_18250 [Roseivirga misakiensis]
MITFFIVIYGVLFLVELFLVLSFWFRFKKVPIISADNLPYITVLVCARDEEGNLEGCLNSILASDYPIEKMEILVGNDNSEDSTPEIVAAFASKYSSVKGVEIQHEKDGLIAKANVLNQLIDQSSHQFQVIIDADMEVASSWLKTMVSALDAGYDMVSGYTRVKRSNWLANLQFMDWQTVLHTMKSMADLIRPISILGNNMAFNKLAYDKVGGFIGLGPTDVEDLGILQRFQKSGFKTIQLVEQKGYAETKPQLAFNELLTQRCRWMNGVFTHHFILGIPALFARLWVVFFAISLFLSSEVAFIILAYGLVTSWLKSRTMTIKTKSSGLIFIIEPIIISLLDTLALLRLIFIGKVSWKGRKHS